METVGPFRVVPLLDALGTFPSSVGEAFPGAPAEALAAARQRDPAAFGDDGGWRLAFRCFAVRGPDGGTVLVDAGIGPHGSPAAAWAPVPGVLPAALAAARIAPADVSVVVLTHLHEDHVGWAVDDALAPRFASARHLVQHADVAALPAAGAVADRVVAPLRRAGLLEELDGAITLAALDGARLDVVPTPGHTPGHQSLVVDGGGRRVVVTGDVLVAALQLVAPDVAYRFEQDQALARRTRRRLLAEARRRPTLLATAHLTEPFVAPDGAAAASAPRAPEEQR